MGEKWAITGDGSNLQRSYLPSVERFHCLMLTLEYVTALENTCKNNKNITVEEIELWYHVCDQKGTLRSEETTGMLCVCVCPTIKFCGDTVGRCKNVEWLFQKLFLPPALRMVGTECHIRVCLVTEAIQY